MIEISLSAALILYSSILGLFAVGIWVYTEITTRRSFYVLERQNLWRCIFCGYIYLDQEAEAVSQCPRCASYNAASDENVRFVKTAPSKDEATECLQGEEPARNASHRKRPHQRHRGPRHR